MFAPRTVPAPRHARAATPRVALVVALLVALLAACSTAGDGDDGPFVEDEDRAAPVWVSPGATLAADEPIAVAVALDDPTVRRVRFALDGREVGVCDPRAPDEDCHADALWQWAVAVDGPGRYTLTASVERDDGSTRVTALPIDVAATAAEPDETEAAPEEPDPLDASALVAEGTGAITQAISVARGYLDPSSRMHRVCGGQAWAVSGQRVVLERGARIDGSSAAVARCVAAHGASVRRYADARAVSRASVVAQLVRAGNCGPEGWRAPVLPAAQCAALARLDRAACRARMVASPDFAIDTLTRFLALRTVRAFDRRDPPRVAMALEGRTRVACTRRNAWHAVESRAGAISAYVAAYNAYRTWERGAIPAGPSTTKVPAEFIARTYVEALGRMPEQTEWNDLLARYRAAGCSAESLRATTDLFARAEFRARPFTAAERVLALYRGALGREPDPAGFAHYTARLAADPGAWADVVAAFETTPEYVANAASICDPARANYHPEASHPPLPIAGSMTAAALQALLDAARPGDVVAPPAGTLVVADTTVHVPAGVTLATAGVADGLAGRLAHARLVRIVRGAPFDAPLVRLHPGAQLEHVWLDGRRMQWPAARVPHGMNVYVEPSGAAASRVRWIRSDNPVGPQNIRFGGSSDPNGCAAAMEASENLVGNYSNDNRLAGAIWADGIFTQCENTTVARNEVIDASDVALIAFFSSNASPQHSRFVDNRVLAAGNDAFGGLGTDPWSGARGSCAGDCDFTGTVFENNILFTGPNTRFVVGISAGTRAWGFIQPHGNGRGARYSHNTAGSARARVQLAVYVSGMLDAHLEHNWDPATLEYASEPAVPANHCGTGATLANTGAFASGELQGAAHADRDDCL